jgi:hypothetical protein
MRVNEDLMIKNTPGARRSGYGWDDEERRGYLREPQSGDPFLV